MEVMFGALIVELVLIQQLRAVTAPFDGLHRRDLCEQMQNKASTEYSSF